MLVWRHGRGLLAGMGVTGSLLAAVAAGFALTGGVLGFNSWPSAGSAAADRALRVASPFPRAERAAPLILPVAAAGRPAPAAGPLVTTGGAARPGAPIERRRSTTRAPQPARSPAPAAPGAAAAQSAPTAPPAAPAQPTAARLVTDTTHAAAGVLRTATAGASQAPAAGPLVAGAGAQAATAVEAGGGIVAGLAGGG